MKYLNAIAFAAVGAAAIGGVVISSVQHLANDEARVMALVFVGTIAFGASVAAMEEAAREDDDPHDEIEF